MSIFQFDQDFAQMYWEFTVNIHQLAAKAKRVPGNVLIFLRSTSTPQPSAFSTQK